MYFVQCLASEDLSEVRAVVFGDLDPGIRTVPFPVTSRFQVLLECERRHGLRKNGNTWRHSASEIVNAAASSLNGRLIEKHKAINSLCKYVSWRAMCTVAAAPLHRITHELSTAPRMEAQNVVGAPCRTRENGQVRRFLVPRNYNSCSCPLVQVTA